MRFGASPIDDPQLDQVRGDYSKAWHYVEMVEREGQPRRWYQVANDPDRSRVAYLRKLAYQRYGSPACRGLRFKTINGEDEEGHPVVILCVRLEPDQIVDGAWEKYQTNVRAKNRVNQRTSSGRRARREVPGTVSTEAGGSESNGMPAPAPGLEGFGVGEVGLPDATDDGPEPRAVGDE